MTDGFLGAARSCKALNLIGQDKGGAIPESCYGSNLRLAERNRPYDSLTARIPDSDDSSGPHKYFCTI